MFLTSSPADVVSTKEFNQLIKCIGETRSKQEEDRLLEQEVGRLRAWSASGAEPTKELVCRALYCHMLGHDVRAAVNLVSIVSKFSTGGKGDSWFRYLGFTLISQLLPDDDEALLLLVNSIHNDMTRKFCGIRVAISLNFMSQRICSDSVPLLYSTVMSLIDHPSDHVRKKCLNALTRLAQKMRTTKHIDFDFAGSRAGCPPHRGVLSKDAPFAKLIHDRSYSVTLAYLNLVEELFKSGIVAKAVSDDGTAKVSEEIRTFISQLVCILKNLVLGANSASNGIIPNPHDDAYHRVTAPWLQIKIMRLLVKLVNKNPQLSQECYEVLRLCLVTISPTNICYALQYECILTICGLYPHPALCRLAANVIRQFLESRNRNLRLCGINALMLLVDIDANFIAGHELIIIDSLNDSDPTIKIKALNLLTHITNTTNVLNIIDKLLTTVETMSAHTIYTNEQTPLVERNESGGEITDSDFDGKPAGVFVDRDCGKKDSLKRQIIVRSYQLIDAFAPSIQAYIDTVARLMKTHPKYFDEKLCLPQFVAMVSEGSGADDESGADYKCYKHTLEQMLDVYKTVRFEHHSVIVAALWAISFCMHTLSNRTTVAREPQDSVLDQELSGLEEDELGALADYAHAGPRSPRVDSASDLTEESVVRTLVDRFSLCFPLVPCQQSLRFMLYTLIQITGSATNGNLAERYVEPLVNKVLSQHWDFMLKDYLRELMEARKRGRLSSLYPIMGYTEDVGRYVDESVLEACLAELDTRETPEMIQLLTEADSVAAAAPVTAPDPGLNVKPYDDRPKEKQVRASTQQLAAEFAVKKIGSRWSVQEGLKKPDFSNRLPVEIDRSPSVLDRDPGFVDAVPLEVSPSRQEPNFNFSMKQSKASAPRVRSSTAARPPSLPSAPPSDPVEENRKLQEADKLFAGVI